MQNEPYKNTIRVENINIPLSELVICNIIEKLNNFVEKEINLEYLREDVFSRIVTKLTVYFATRKNLNFRFIGHNL